MNDFFNFDDASSTVTTPPVTTPPVVDTTPPVTEPVLPVTEPQTFDFDAPVVTPLVTDEVNTDAAFLSLLSELSKEDTDITEDLIPKTVDIESVKDVLSKYGENKISSFIKGAVTDSPLLGNILSYVKDGGDPSVLAAHFNNTPLASKLPFETAEDKKAFLLTAYTKFEDKSIDEAEILVKAIEDNGKLDSISENLRTKLINKEVKDIENFAITAKNEKAKVEKERQLYSDTVNSIISSADEKEFKGLDIKNTPKLLNYVADYKYKDAENKEYTQFDVDLNNALKDNKKKLILAALLKTDFDFSNVALKAKEALVANVNPPTNKVITPVVTTGKPTHVADEFYDFIKAHV